MKQYSSYKNSSEKSLNKIPEHWSFKRAKSVFKIIDIRSSDGSEELLSVSEKQGVALRKNTNVTMFQAANYAGYKLCWPQDLVINSLWAWMNGLGFSEYHGIVSTAYSVFRIWNRDAFDYKYGNYLLRSKIYNWEFRVRSKGIWRSRYQLSDDSFLSMPLLLPPLPEQQQIAQYLDWKTTKINKYIQAKKKLIALLKEQKKNIINEAVTKGINPDVKMKDSGIEWIGEVPTSWKILKLRCILKPISMRNRPELPLLSVTRENGVILRNINCKEENHNFIPDDLSYYKVVKKGQFAMNKMKAWQGSYGVSDYEGIVSPAYYIFNLTDVETLFFHTAIRSNYYIPFFKWASDGVRIGQWDLNQNRMKEIPFFIPPISEQKEITNHIKIKTKSIDETIKRTEQEISLMMEFSSRLISDVVSGKVDIRSIEIPDFEPIEAHIDISEDESTNEELVVEDM